jgi:hypothetical protein
MDILHHFHYIPLHDLDLDLVSLCLDLVIGYHELNNQSYRFSWYAFQLSGFTYND